MNIHSFFGFVSLLLLQVNFLREVSCCEALMRFVFILDGHTQHAIETQ